MKFPARPWPVHPSFRRRAIIFAPLVFVAGLGILIATLVSFWGDVRLILREKQIWEAGHEPRAWKVNAERKKEKGFFNSYKLNVEWVDEQGKAHTNQQKYSTAINAIDENWTLPGLSKLYADVTMPVDETNPPPKQPAPVRYDPDDPSLIAWGAAVQASSGRWISAGFMLAVFGAVAAGFIWFGISARRTYRVVVKGGIAGRPSSLKIIAVQTETHRRKATGNRYTLEHPVSGKPFKHFFSMKEKPMFSQGGSHLVAILVEGEAKPVVLNEDGYPYAFGQAGGQA